eukprot:7383657-Prymnesium_polylepis.1
MEGSSEAGLLEVPGDDGGGFLQKEDTGAAEFLADVAVDFAAEGAEFGGDPIGVFWLGIHWRSWRVAIGAIEGGGSTANVDGGHLTRTTSAG